MVVMWEVSHVEKLDVTMLETLKTDLSDVSADYMEIGLDGILDDGLLKDIPVVKSIISLYKTGVNIRERFLIKKLLVFLTSLSDTTIDDRLKFIRKHEKESAKIGEELIVLLDRLDHVNKPVYVAKLFKHYLNEEISLIVYQRLCQIIDRCFIEDLRFLKENAGSEIVTGIEALGLANNGLAVRASFDGGSFDEVNHNPKTDYKINELGKLLIRYAL
jgi:hypothetical protein